MSSTKCTACGNNYDTVEYFQRDDGFEYKRCFFCRSTKADMRALVLDRDVTVSNLVNICKTEAKDHRHWEQIATDLREQLTISLANSSSSIAKYEDVTGQMIEAQLEINALKREKHSSNVCEGVQHENIRLKGQILELKNTMKASVDYETRELRAELKKLRRVVKKQRQKDRKQSMAASSMRDVQPPGYESEDEAVPPPSYDSVY